MKDTVHPFNIRRPLQQVFRSCPIANCRTSIDYYTVAGWSSPQDISRGFVDPNNFSTPEIVCHIGATPGGAYATVAAGETVQLQWTEWPVSHHGPVIDYLANCNGECTTVDKTNLLFNKIGGVGLFNWTAQPGLWASDQLISTNNTWTVTIPSTVAPGNYVLRHEIIALHSANNANGAQNYPQCVNLKVTGSGTDSLSSGTPGNKLYSPTDPGILVNIYTKMSSYEVPGPTTLVGAKIDSQSTLSSASLAYPVPASATVTQSPASATTTPTPASATITQIPASTTAIPSPTSVTIPPPPNTLLVTPSASPTAIPGDPSGCPAPQISTISILPADPSVKAAPTASGGTYPSAAPSPASLPETVTMTEVYDWLKALLRGWFRLRKHAAQRRSQHARDFHA